MRGLDRHLEIICNCLSLASRVGSNNTKALYNRLWREESGERREEREGHLDSLIMQAGGKEVDVEGNCSRFRAAPNSSLYQLCLSALRLFR